MDNSVQGTHWGEVSDYISVVDCHGFVVGVKIYVTSQTGCTGSD